MSPRLDAAAKRLQSALSQIEAAIESRQLAGLAGGDEGVRDLADQLAAVRAESQDLAAANVSVAARLDSAIDRLRAVLRT